MSAYPWMQRHRRYLSFRYLFPQIAAGWLHCRRALLRVRWFFTHSVDEFLGQVRELLLWPFVVLSQLGQWLLRGVGEFLTDLVHGISTALRWVGRLPVWTGAAVAGVVGIMLTILLFLPAMPINPVPASIPAAQTSSASAARSADENPIVDAIVPDETDFDPFAPIDESSVDAHRFAESSESPVPPFDVRSPASTEPELIAELSRLSMPFGWDSRRTMDVVSIPSPPSQAAMMAFEDSALDGWNVRNDARQQLKPERHFTPYVSRAGSRTTRTTPSWLTPEATIGSEESGRGRRQPSVVIEKKAARFAPAGRPWRYTLLVRNSGEETLGRIKVAERVSAIDRVSDVRPPAIVVGDTLVWTLTDLNPGGERKLHVDLLPVEPLSLTQESRVEVTASVAAASTVRAPRPEPVEWPSVPLSEPEPFAESDAQPLAEAETEPSDTVLPSASRQPTDRPAREAEPAPAQPQPEMFPWADEPLPEPPSQHEPLLPTTEDATDSSEDAPPPSSTREPVPSTFPQPDSDREGLSLKVFTPPAVTTGGPVRTVFELHNRGDRDVTDVVLAVTLSEELQHRHGRSLELQVGRLAAGETYRTQLTTRAIRDGTAHLSSRLTCAESPETSAERDVRIAGDVARPSDIVYDGPMICPPLPPFF